jgi:hypothetical protein
MKKLVILIMAGALLFLLASVSGATSDDASVLTAAVVVEDDDLNMRLAHDCLARIRASKANDGDTVLVKVLAATGFKLEKVVAKEFKNDPRRIRFGFEFGNPNEVKSVYWEADCPVTSSEELLTSR